MKLKDVIMQTADCPDVDTVVFQTAGGADVKVHRRLEHWTPALEIHVNGLLWCRKSASKADMALFNLLVEKATQRRRSAHEQGLLDADIAARKIFEE